MKIGPKYKIARRLGAPVFEKTQTQKYTLSESKRAKAKRRPRPRTDYGIQMLEKQKARYTYMISEKQFSRYVREATEANKTNNADALFEFLELRLDNAVYRLGLAPTRQAARQMVSHGHIMINGRRVTIPSYRLSEGVKISIRPQSITKPLFADLDEKLKRHTAPSWLKFDHDKKEAVVQGMPKKDQVELLFDLTTVLEFYSR